MSLYAIFLLLSLLSAIVYIYLGYYGENVDDKYHKGAKKCMWGFAILALASKVLTSLFT